MITIPVQTDTCDNTQQHGLDSCRSNISFDKSSAGLFYSSCNEKPDHEMQNFMSTEVKPDIAKSIKKVRFEVDDSRCKEEASS